MKRGFGTKNVLDLKLVVVTRMFVLVHKLHTCVLCTVVGVPNFMIESFLT